MLRSVTAVVVLVAAIVATAVVATPATAASPKRGPVLWRALDGKVTCGVAFHLEGKPAKDILCMSRVIPRPRNPPPYGDPGFAYLGGKGRPRRVQISQYSWTFPVRPFYSLPKLKPGRVWRYGNVGVRCKVTTSKVTCTNRARHGFVISKKRYRGF